MGSAKLFEIGGSQAVALPEGWRLPGEEVLADRIGDTVILLPKDGRLRAALDLFTEDFLEDGREQPLEQERDPL